MGITGMLGSMVYSYLSKNKSLKLLIVAALTLYTSLGVFISSDNLFCNEEILSLLIYSTFSAAKINGKENRL